MRTPWFLLLLLLTALQMLRMNHFIATVRAQYAYLLASDRDAAAINSFFDAALPVSGVAATPLVAAVLNSFSVAAVLAILTACIAVNGLLNCLPFLWAGFATVLEFVTLRPFYYSAVSHTATQMFGFETFGLIYGTIICAAGLVNAFQSALDSLMYGPLGGNPTPINMALAGAGTVVGAFFAAFVAIKSRRWRESSQQGSLSERLSLIQDDDREYGTSIIQRIQ
ncbi:hypothetical protein CDD83_4598 [Cordyceps sp. RAO-2017]|nr:hypothetical protein CDD83_4598 [Cordyceps sp. RAO-2017]